MTIFRCLKVSIPYWRSKFAYLVALATVQKLISELLPSDLTFAKESRDLLIDCCVEFIHLVSSEANEICERETKKTISAEHVVKALTELGFEDYVHEIQEIAVEHKEQQKVITCHFDANLIDRFEKRSKTNSISQACHRRSCNECRRNCWGNQGLNLNKPSIEMRNDVLSSNNVRILMRDSPSGDVGQGTLGRAPGFLLVANRARHIWSMLNIARISPAMRIDTAVYK